jgi:hypothetical protein
MTRNHDADLIVRNLRGVSTDVGGGGAFSVKDDGIQPFMFWTTRPLTTDEMILLCRKLAAAIRREIPERPDGWAARLLAGNAPAMIMGDYYFGWAGRADEWHLREGRERKATDATEWSSLYERLRETLIGLGRIEGTSARDGEFFVSDYDYGHHKQTVFLRQPEFLTKELIAAIQNLLADGYTHWAVHIFAAFDPPLEILWKGIDIRADGVEDRWNRRQARKLLGDRLKI